MFANFRRISKFQCVQLLTAGLLLCVVMVSWEELDHHVVSHVRSYTYRYLVNDYDFLNSSFKTGPGRRYSYLINHPGKCRGAGEGRGGTDRDGRGRLDQDVLLLLFVKSAPDNWRRRRAIRDTWGNESFARSELGANVKVLFALGVHPDAGLESGVQRALRREDRVYGDLIQQDFADTFHNLTNKLILQFQWGLRYCPQAHFLMSADDDVFVHTPNLVEYLRGVLGSRAGARDLWAGHVHRGSPPNRRKDSKYYVSRELYPWQSYPDYTAGGGYVVSGDVAAKIQRAALLLDSSMYIDDIFMGICAKAAGVSPRQHVHFSGEGKAPYHPCVYEHMITSHGHADDVRQLWRAATDVATRSRGLMGNLYCKAVRVMMLCRPLSAKTYPCMAAFS